jgi:hypothetical protein
MYQVDTMTTTVRRPLSSTVPSLASGYSTTTIDGELILLCRLAYRVKRLYRVGKILSSIVLLLLQSGSVHDDTTTTMQLVVLYQDKHHTTIAITQLVVLYQDKYHTIAVVSSLDRNGEYYYLYNHSNATAPATSPATAPDIAPDTATTATATTTTTTTIDGELIVSLFRLHQVDIMYQVDTIQSSIVLLLLYHNFASRKSKRVVRVASQQRVLFTRVVCACNE